MNGKKAFMVLPPISVATGSLETTTWSPSGEYLLVNMVTPLVSSQSTTDQLSTIPTNPLQELQMRDELYLYDSHSRKSTLVWKGGYLDQIQTIQWFHSGKSALIYTVGVVLGQKMNVVGTSLKVRCFNATDHSMRTIAAKENPSPDSTNAGYFEFYFHMSPVNDQAVIDQQSAQIQSTTGASLSQKGSLNNSNPITTIIHKIELVNGSGQVLRRLPSIPDVHGYSWSPDGAVVYGDGYGRSKTGKFENSYYFYDHNGRFDRLAQAPLLYHTLAQSPPWLTLTVHRMKVKVNGRFESILEVLLHAAKKSIQQTCLLGGIIEQPILAPNLKAVSYVANGTCFVRRIIVAPPTLIAWLVQAERAKAISCAKQVCLGLIMFSGDHNDNLPNGGDWYQGVYPYVKNSDLMANFVYLEPNNPLLTSMQNPSGTEIGYVPGPGGQAIAYADGHVHWQSQP